MKDRFVEYPHRYKDKATGQIFDFEALPGEILEAGTPLCKATLLRDPTASQLELSEGDAIPDRAFSKITGAVKLTADNKSALGLTGSFALQEANKELTRFKRHKVGYFGELRGCNLAGKGSTGDGSTSEALHFQKKYNAESGEQAISDGKLYAPNIRAGLGDARVLIKARVLFSMKSVDNSPFSERIFEIKKNGQALQRTQSQMISAFTYKEEGAFYQTKQNIYSLDIRCVSEISGSSDYFELCMVWSGSSNMTYRIESGNVQEFSLQIID